jgi:WD40 repeat protein
VRQVWDALTGDELFELKHRKIVRAADWSADSAHIVTGGKEGVLRLYDVNRPEAEPSMLEGHTPNSLIKVPPRHPLAPHLPPPTSHLPSHCPFHLASHLASRLPPSSAHPLGRASWSSSWSRTSANPNP